MKNQGGPRGLEPKTTKPKISTMEYRRSQKDTAADKRLYFGQQRLLTSD